MQLSYYKKAKLPPCYTEEFRDPEMWKILKQQIVPNLPKAYVIRVWSAGCASGEEAFSLAKIMQEFLEPTTYNLKPKYHISIYGTDIREVKLIEARAKIPKNLKPETYNLIPNIRFRYHDLVADEPLKYMNLILCRNVLMFFKPIYQDIILQKLYNSLRTKGYLVLGRGECLKYEIKRKFKEIDGKNRIFQKI